MKAKTEDGRSVVLNADGTWLYAPANNDATIGESGFRGARWGASVEDVLASESSALVRQNGSVLVYEGTLAGMSTEILYFFVGDMLVRAKYFVTADYTNNIQYVYKRSELDDLLVKKYGAPSSRDQLWHGDLYQDNPSEWGMAVAVGDLTWYTTWESNSTTVLLALTGNDYQCHLQVEYASTELKSLEDVATTSRDLDQL